MVTKATRQDAAPLRTLAGIFHLLEVYPDRLVIKRTDVLSMVMHGDEVIPVKDIAAIRLVPSERPDSSVKLTLLLRNHKIVGVSFHVQQCPELRAVRGLIEEQMTLAGIPVEPSEQQGCAE